MPLSGIPSSAYLSSTIPSLHPSDMLRMPTAAQKIAMTAVYMSKKLVMGKESIKMIEPLPTRDISSGKHSKMLEGL